MIRTPLLPSHTSSSKALLWLGLLALVPYTNVLQNGFVWDDKLFIIDNYYIRNPLFVFSSFSNHMLLGNRPAMSLSLALDFTVWRLNPAGFHLSNLLLHTLNVFLVYFLALRIPGGQRFALLAGLLFALHPVHSEAVAAMLGRSDLLVAAFALLSLLSYHRFLYELHPLRRGGFYSITLVCYIAACLTKESSIILPLLFVCCENWAWSETSSPRSWKVQGASLMPFLALAVLFLFFRQRSAPDVGQQAWGGGAWQTALLMMVVIWKYFVLLVFPCFLSPYYIIQWPEGWGYLQVLGGLFVLLGGLFLINRYYRQSPLVAWALAWIGLCLIPYLNIIPIPGAMMNERWLYLPSVGFCMLLAWGLHVLLIHVGEVFRKIFWGFGLALLVLAAVRIVSWNAVWRDDEVLTRTMLQEYPQSQLAHNNRGNYFYASGRLEEAKEEYAQALRLDLGSSKTAAALIHANLGNVLYAAGDSSKGMAEYRTAVSLDSTYLPNLFTRGHVYHSQGKLDSALVYYQRILSRDPLHLLTLTDAGIIYLEKKDVDRAEECLRKAQAIAPQDSLVNASLRKIQELRAEQRK